MSEDNPLENADVKALLADADNLNSPHDFHNWQKSFLDAFTKFLDSKGSDKAKEAYDKFRNSSGGLFKIVKTLTAHIEDGSLSKERVSVKGRRAVTELGTVLNKLVEALQLILPTTSTQITKFGFTKYHMGAVLVEDGFKEYAVMQFCKKLLQHLRVQALDEIASQQVLEEIDYFGKKFDVFCGVMESLNLMNVCKIAEKFLHSELTQETNRVLDVAPPAEPVSSPPLPLPEKKKEFTVTVTYPEGSEGAQKPPNTTIQTHDMMQKKLDPPNKKNGKKKKKDEDDSVSSYEDIEEIITVSSYETVEMEDDSSYETLEVVEESEYETDEEEVVVSDYVTDSDDSEAEREVKKKPKPKKKKKADKPIAKKKTSKGAPEPTKPKAAPQEAKPKGGSNARPRKAPAKSSAPPPEQSNGLPPPGQNNDEGMDDGAKESDQDEPDSNHSSDSEKKHNDKELFGHESDSDSSGQGNIKIRAPVAPDSAPPSPTSNEKPVKRIEFTSKDFYHGHSNNDCFNAWKLYKKDKNGESEHDRQKKMKRIERVEIVTTRRRVKERQVKTIRQKKDKPPKVVRVRKTHQVVEKKRVKKEKPED